MVFGNAVENYREQIWKENSHFKWNLCYITGYISILCINPLVQSKEQRKL